MKYVQRSFTLPASNRTSQKTWDRAFLSPEAFLVKYAEEGPDAGETSCTKLLTASTSETTTPTSV